MATTFESSVAKTLVDKQAERERLHEKTFKAWINAQLRVRKIKLERHLMEEMKDGLALINLMEVLSGDKCSERYHARPSLEMHRIENTSIAINFVTKYVGKLSVSSSDLQQGNTCIVLGMIWRIILTFRVDRRRDGEADNSGLSAAQRNREAKKNLLEWCSEMTRGHQGVEVKGFVESWSDGLGFCALVHAFDPTLIDYQALKPENAHDNLELAFTLAEEHLDIPRLLDPADICATNEASRPDEQCFMAYIAEWPIAFRAHGKDVLPRDVAVAREQEEEEERKRLEAERLRAAEEEEEERKRKAAADEAERERLAAERLQAEAEERARREAEEEARRKAEAEAAAAAAAAAAAVAEEERKRQAAEAEAERLRAAEEEEERKRKQEEREEAERRAAEAEAEERRQREAQAAALLLLKEEEEERKRKQAEEEEEIERMRNLEEVERKRREEEEEEVRRRRREEEEEEEVRKLEEEERKRKREEEEAAERLRIEMEKEKEMKRIKAEKKKKREEKKRKQQQQEAEALARRQAEEEEERKRRAEEEAAKLKADEAKRRQEEEDEEARRKAAELAKLEAERAANSKQKHAGTLKVVIKEARGLKVKVNKNKDGSKIGDKASSSECTMYCTLGLGQQRERTKPTKRDQCPKWPEGTEFELVVADPKDALEINLWDQNRLLADTFLGRVSFRVKSLGDRETICAWFKLEGKKANVPGELCIALLYTKTEDRT